MHEVCHQSDDKRGQAAHGLVSKCSNSPDEPAQVDQVMLKITFRRLALEGHLVFAKIGLKVCPAGLSAGQVVDCPYCPESEIMLRGSGRKAGM